LKTGVVEPYRLPKGPNLFVDWRYVRAGAVQWVSKDNTPLSLWGVEGQAGTRPSPMDVPKGIRIVVQKAQKSEPFLTRNKPWEHMLYCYSTVIYTEACYRLWYEVSTPEHADILCYAESKDGMVWDKPSLGIMQYQGMDANIVFGGSLCPETGFHGGGVFPDPSATSGERYKMVFLGKTGVCGAVSHDGLHWKQFAEPLLALSSDTQNTAYYDDSLKRYVGFFRMWRHGRRCVGRAETDVFHRWPNPTPVLCPSPSQDASDDWYTNSKSTYPGTVDYHFMFPALYHRAVDSTELHMFSSPDGIVWIQVPGGPVLSPGPPGSWDSGCIFGGVGLVPLPNDRVGLPYTGFPVPHKYPRSLPMGSIAYALWPRERLTALEASEEGEFTTPRLIFTGRKLLLNVQTKRAGQVLAEAADSHGTPLPGRSFAEADPVNGDAADFPVTWKGEADLGHTVGQPVVLRFRLRAAKLFAFEFV